MITHYTGEAGSLREGGACFAIASRLPLPRPRYAGACPRGGKKTAKREGSGLRPGFVEPELVGSSYLGATRVAVEARMAQANGCD